MRWKSFDGEKNENLEKESYRWGYNATTGIRKRRDRGGSSSLVRTTTCERLFVNQFSNHYHQHHHTTQILLGSCIIHHSHKYEKKRCDNYWRPVVARHYSQYLQNQNNGGERKRVSKYGTNLLLIRREGHRIPRILPWKGSPQKIHGTSWTIELPETFLTC